MPQQAVTHAMQSSTLSDVLERVLDKGVVIAGDIKIKLVDIELLSIQIRLVICSVDKAKEMGMDWWVNNPSFAARPRKDNWKLRWPNSTRGCQGWRRPRRLRWSRLELLWPGAGLPLQFREGQQREVVLVKFRQLPRPSLTRIPGFEPDCDGVPAGAAPADPCRSPRLGHFPAGFRYPLLHLPRRSPV